MEAHLTDDARRTLQLARDEAQSLNHRVVGTGHLLLGLVRMVVEGGTAPGVEALRSLLRHRSEDAIRANVTKPSSLVGHKASPIGNRLRFA